MKKFFMTIAFIFLSSTICFASDYKLVDPNNEVTDNAKVSRSYETLKTETDTTSVSELIAENEKIDSIISGINTQIQGLLDTKSRNLEKINKIRSDLSIIAAPIIAE